ncbi:hypothetical protein [Caballeronia sp. Lep1P3]|uniref:hypothetical protein n=1 Tax=Caballeronia sp. Lep1P3 TaxID=2878150 RepID=UPI001FD453D5|nr:hypothetical protein [Caballeronia sp. Lep1P3]
MKRKALTQQLLIADTTPMHAFGLKILFGGSVLPGSLELASCNIELNDRLEHRAPHLLILDPAFVQKDLDLGNTDSLVEFRNRFPALPLLLYTTVTDPVVLDAMTSITGIGIASKTDEMPDLIHVFESLFNRNCPVVSPKISELIRAADRFRQILPDSVIY